MPRSTQPEERICPECGVSFPPRRPWQQCCSRRCTQRLGQRRLYHANPEKFRAKAKKARQKPGVETKLKAYKAQWREQNRQKCRAYNRAYRQRYRERINAAARERLQGSDYYQQYYRKNRARILAQHKKYRQAHQEKSRLKSRLYYVRNRAQILAKQAKRSREQRALQFLGELESLAQRSKS